MVAEVIGECSQSEDYKLWFLVPESYVGIFIGKKGTNLKEMKKGTTKVALNVHRKPVSLGGNNVVPCIVFGPSDDALKVIERAANWLGEISVKVQADKEAGNVSVVGGAGLPDDVYDLQGGYQPGSSGHGIPMQRENVSRYDHVPHPIGRANISHMQRENVSRYDHVPTPIGHANRINIQRKNVSPYDHVPPANGRANRFRRNF